MKCLIVLREYLIRSFSPVQRRVPRMRLIFAEYINLLILYIRTMPKMAANPLMRYYRGTFNKFICCFVIQEKKSINK